MMSSTVICGCGYTGRALARKLAGRGQRVVGTTRRPEGVDAIARAGLEPLVWAAPQRLPLDDVSTVYALFPPRGVDPDEAAEALSGAQRVVYVSSTSVYGDRQGGWVTDETETAPCNPWARSRVAAERAFLNRGAIVVRAAGIYGSDRSIVQRLKASRLRNTGDPDRPVNLIHVDDLASILIAAAARGQPGDIYLAGQPVLWSALAAEASRLTGIPLPDASPLPDDPNIRMFYTESKRCRPARYEELGITLAHPDIISSLSAP